MTAMEGVQPSEGNDKFDEDEKDTLKMLIASDCHIGYMEKDPERRDDSLITFEEILQIAKAEKVDMILLGGDLFHFNKPSRYFRYGCMRLLREYCKRDEAVKIEYLTDPRYPEDTTNCFPVKSNHLRHQTPVFSIHGNHDNPAGVGNLCELDVLSEAGLINHFGKSQSHDSVEMIPVLMKKGRTKVALYGLGSITDKALHGLFEKGKVSMRTPPEAVTPWFTMFMIHQNRAYRGDKEYIPESFLDEKLNVKLDLVVWGHEHDCHFDPVWHKKKFRIIQPGSSIATSIVSGEAKQKHVGVLEIRGRYMRCTKIPLQTVRPMYIKSIALQNPENALKLEDVDIESKVEDFCASQIRKMIEAVTRNSSTHPKRPSLPLIKLRVDVTGGYPTFNKRRFAQQFARDVANVRVHGHDEQNLIDFKDKDEKNRLNLAAKDAETSKSELIEDSITEALSEAKGGKHLKVLSPLGLVELLREFVTNDNNAHSELVDLVLYKATDFLQETSDENFLDTEFKKFRKQRKDMQEAEVNKEIQRAINLAKKAPRKKKRGARHGGGFQRDLLNKTDVSPRRARGRPRGRPRGRGRGRGCGRGRGRGRGARIVFDNYGIEKAKAMKRKRVAMMLNSSSSSSNSSNNVSSSEGEASSSPERMETDMTPMSPLKDDDQSDLEWESYDETSADDEELE